MLFYGMSDVKKIWGGLFLSFLLLFCVNIESAKAVSIESLFSTPVAGDFVIGPGKEELELDPGGSSMRGMTITNRFGKDMNFKVEIEDFTGSKDMVNNVVLMGAAKGPYSLKDYIKPEVSTFLLKHGDRITLPIEIKIPVDATPGGLYGAVIITTVPAKTDDGKDGSNVKSNLTVVARLASLYFLRVKGEVKESGQLKEFYADRKFYENGPINFKMVYENSGSVYVNPYGQIKISNMVGTGVDEIDITKYFVLPDSLRLKEFKLDRPFMIGRYKAEITLYRGYGGLSDQQSVYFWVIPWKIMIGVFVGAVLILWLFSRFISWIKNNFEIQRKNK